MAGNDIERAGSRAVGSYAPGITRSAITRGVVTRFLPGSVATLGMGMTLLGLPGSSTSWLDLAAGVAIIAGSLSLGYLSGMEVLRHRLYPDASVDGRKSFIAGLMAPLAAFLIMGSGVPLRFLEGLALFAAVGVLMAVLMFFAWLTPTPDDLRPAVGVAPCRDDVDPTRGTSPD